MYLGTKARLDNFGIETRNQYVTAWSLFVLNITR
jgi:hypothetical protein